jgi:hypothetical protein
MRTVSMNRNSTDRNSGDKNSGARHSGDRVSMNRNSADRLVLTKDSSTDRYCVYRDFCPQNFY